MIVAYQDELGFVSVQIDGEHGIVFADGRAYFTDENGKDYKVNAEHLISIEKAE